MITEVALELELDGDALNIRRLDLNLLTIFDMVMVERHVTRASERLGLTQSAVSNAISRLRIHFEDPLFVKASRGVEPTPRATALWKQTHEAITQINQAAKATDFIPGQARTEFRMSLVDLSAATLLPHLFRCVSPLAPHVSITSIPHVGELIEERFARGEIDFAISAEPPRLTALESKPLWSERYVLAGRRDHPALQQPITLDDLTALPQLQVNLSGTSGFRVPIDVALSQIGRARPIAMTVNQFLVATTMLRESDLVAVLPAPLVSDAFRSNWLSYQELPIAMSKVVLHLIWHRRNNALLPMLWFRDRILEAVAAMNLEERTMASAMTL